MTLEPYYEDDLVTLYHGDALSVMSRLTEKFDLAFTSPPYNLGALPWPALGHWEPGAVSGSGGGEKWSGGANSGDGVDYDQHDDALPWSEYVEQQRSTISAMWSLLAEAGAIFYNHKPRVVGSRLWLPYELFPEHALLRQEIVWARAGGMNYSPTYYVPTHERIYVLAQEAWRLRSKGASGLGDVWRVPQQPSDHPAPFPVDLPARAIESTGARTVLDPYAGSGTTLRAAKDAGVRAVGVESSERYCEMAAARLGSWEHAVAGAGTLWSDG